VTNGKNDLYVAIPALLADTEAARMQLDFARVYAGKSDDELRLLIQDRHDLVDEARDALDAEVAKRKRDGFQIHVKEPEEPRLHVEEDEDGNEVVVHSRDLVFPEICPRCLAPGDAIVRISCLGGSGGVLGIDVLLGLWRYLFRRYAVPFCRACAISVRVRRWVQRLFFAGTFAFALYLTGRYGLSFWRFAFVIGCTYMSGFALWMLLGLPKRWPAAGIEILSSWSAKDRRLEFAKPEYEKAFVALNGRKHRR
jgi:hypothetical protein